MVWTGWADRSSRLFLRFLLELRRPRNRQKSARSPPAVLGKVYCTLDSCSALQEGKRRGEGEMIESGGKETQPTCGPQDPLQWISFKKYPFLLRAFITLRITSSAVRSAVEGRWAFNENGIKNAACLGSNLITFHALGAFLPRISTCHRENNYQVIAEDITPHG